MIVASSRNSSYPASRDNVTSLNSFVTKISHNLLHLLMAENSARLKRHSLRWFLKLVLQSQAEAPAIIIDGSALLNASQPRLSKTFREYASQEMIPKIHRYCSSHRRTYIVFGIYTGHQAWSQIHKRSEGNELDAGFQTKAIFRLTGEAS